MKEINLARQYNPVVLEKLQDTLIEMLNDFKWVCEKYHLTYFAVYGTAIGAVRHGGFIPWDDDLDVGMMRNDFEKFLQIAEKELGDKYQIISPKTEPNCAVSVTKIQMKGTKFVSALSTKVKYEQGIFMDIFPFDYVAPKYRQRKRQLFVTTVLDRLLYLSGDSVVVIPYSGIKKKMAKGICVIVRCALKILRVSPTLLFKLFEEQSTKYNKYKSSRVTCFGQPTALKKMVKKSEMFPVKNVKFGDTTIAILNNTDSLLRQTYGDYMKLPPLEKRINHAPVILEFKK